MKNLTFLLMNHGKIEFREPNVTGSNSRPLIVSIIREGKRKSIMDYISEREMSEAKCLESVIALKIEYAISILNLEIHDKEE